MIMCDTTFSFKIVFEQTKVANALPSEIYNSEM